MNQYLKKVIANFETYEHEVFCEFVMDSKTESITWGMLESSCRDVIYNIDKKVDSQGVVLIFLPHCPDLFPLFLGSMLGGFIPSFMPCTSPRQDSALYWKSHQELINTINPVLVVTNREMQLEMKNAGLELKSTDLLILEDMVSGDAEFRIKDDDEIAFLQHSSGTTGLKKGVMLSYEAIFNHSISYGRSLKIRDDDVIVSWLPTYHDMGLIACLITPTYHAIKTVQMSAFEWLNKPQKYFKLIEQHSATLCWLPNFAFEHMTNTLGKYAEKFNLSSVRAFINCSEPCKAATFERFHKVFGPSGVKAENLHCCYAMAETVFAVSQTDIDEEYSVLTVDSSSLNRDEMVRPCIGNKNSTSFLSCGKIIKELQVDIVDPNGFSLPEGKIGEISISGQYLFSGYNKDLEKTDKVLRKNRYYTNDLGFIYQDQLYVMGRVDDLIIINGRNIYAHQVEAIVNKVSGVKPGRVVALSQFDDKTGSNVMIVLAEVPIESKSFESDITENIIQLLQSELDIVPRFVELVPVGTLIKTSSGKISRKENYKRFKAGEIGLSVASAV